MSTRVRLPNGSYVTVPTDDPKQAAAAARSYWAKQQQQQKPQAPAAPKATQAQKDALLDMVGPGGKGVMLDNVLPGWADEIYAAPAAALAWIKGEDAGAAFRKSQKSNRDAIDGYKKRNPTAGALATGAGFVGGALLPAGKAIKAASLGRKIIQGAGVGAGYGFLAGAGEGEGADVPGRLQRGAQGAESGAMIGAALPPAGRLAGNLGRAARMYVPGVDRAATTLARVPAAVTRAWRGRGAPVRRGPSAGTEQGNRMLARAMNEGHISQGMGQNGAEATPQVIAQEVQRRNGMGVPAIVGDVTQPMREMTEWASRGMGPGQRLVRETLDRRKATEGLRVRQHVQNTMPTTQDPIQFVGDIRQASKDAVAPLYREAYQQPMYRTPPIQAIEQTPAFQEALPQAYRNIRNQIDEVTGMPKDPQAMGFRYFDGDPGSLPSGQPYFPLPDRGYVGVGEGLSTEGYDQVIRAMNDSGRAASHVNPVTGRIESTTNSVHINNRARDLRNLLGEQNAPYQAATERYGDDMAYTSAFNQGTEVGKLTGHDINAQARAMPEMAQQAWATGAGTSMADEASRYGARYPTGDTAAHVRNMLGDETKQQAIGQMSGNSADTRRLQDLLELEHQGNINWKGAYGNSKTASREALDADMNMAAGIPITAAGLRDRLIDFVASRAIPQYQQDVKARIAQVITERDPRTLQEALAAIEEQAVRDQRFADLLHQAGIVTTAAAGMNMKPGAAPDTP